MQESKRLLLINPVNPVRSGFTMNRSSSFPPLGLGVIAALTPDTWDIRLIDENVEPFQHCDADLVGITAFTSAANRAYEIAALYRQRGVPVVMGGIHASMRPDEALQFVDAVVIGEAETAWPMLLADAAAGNLRPVYRGAWRELPGLPRPRRDLFHQKYLFATVQTSRGCPLDCDFCSVTAYNGRRYRRRPPAEVLDELEAIPQDLVFFVDDNIIGYGAAAREAALQLFEGMAVRRLNKLWFCQASVNIADDPAVLDAAAQAGCRMIFLGVEAEDSDALTDMNKRLNLKHGVTGYGETFDRIHRAGIAVLGAFIFGMDGDTPEKLCRRTEYMIESGVDVMQATTITPLPGTQLFDRFQAERRLLYADFPRDWDRYNLTEVVFRPKTMQPAELSQVMRACVRRMYDVPVLKAKAKRTLAATGSWEAARFAWEANMNYRNIALADSTFC
jgi:radical SAM superfamily enzyme YgiQ (UPF0313 family)